MIGDQVDIAAAYLRAGNVVAIPTETVYGLACNALNPEAITKVYEIKERPFFDPLIIHVASVDRISLFANFEPGLLKNIAAGEMPGPITLLLEKKDVIPNLITAGSNKVAIRVPSHWMTQKLLSRLDFPLAAPSANPFGYISPTSAKHVEAQLGHKIPYILDGGPSKIGLESTIIGMENGQLTVYRKGGLSIERLKNYEFSIHVLETSSSNPKSPGMLKSHYAPVTPFELVNDLERAVVRGVKGHKKVGVLFFGLQNIQCDYQMNLSEKGDLNEAAVNLFDYMRKLDDQGLDVIYTSFVPDYGLGLAINDRLRRASV